MQAEDLGFDVFVDTPPPRNDNAEKKSPPPLIQSSAAFVENFTPPDYLIDGVLQQRFFYSLTATTGTGKTAVMLRISAHVALGRPIGNRMVEQGKVLYFAGENPDDIRMRWIGLSQEMGFATDEIDVHFIPGTFKISAMQARIAEEANRLGEFSLVVVDTSAAYFEGDEENSNVQQGAHARRLRALCEVSGGPCVVAACHPIKNATGENLIPRGGGAFLAEVDGNLTARKDDSAVAIHWQGKFRGPEFSEILFGLRTITCDRIKDSRGRLIPTVIAYPMGEDAREEMAAVARTQEDQLLIRLAETPSASLADLARSLGWNLQNGEPNKMRVSRKIEELEKAKLIKRDRDGITLMPAGEQAVAKLKPARKGDDQ